jgi:hypothetical protein
VSGDLFVACRDVIRVVAPTVGLSLARTTGAAAVVVAAGEATRRFLDRLVDRGLVTGIVDARWPTIATGAEPGTVATVAPATTTVTAIATRPVITAGLVATVRAIAAIRAETAGTVTLGAVVTV